VHLWRRASGRNLRTAAARPACSSAITSWTPERPRSTSSVRSSAQLASDSSAPRETPRSLRWPSGPNSVGQQRAHVLDLLRPAGIQERRVQVQIGVRPLDRRAAKPLDGLVEPLGHPTHRRAADTLAHQRLGDVGHLPLGDTAHVGFDHHLVELRAPALVAPHHVGRRALLAAPRHRDVDLRRFQLLRVVLFARAPQSQHDRGDLTREGELRQVRLRPPV